MLSKSILAVALLMCGGCSTIVRTATNSFADALSAGILNQDDLQTVRDGAPAYLLLVDGFISENPDSEALLLAGAELYSSYTALVEDSDRAKRLANRGKQYGYRAICLRSSSLCHAVAQPHDEFVMALQDINTDKDLGALYGFAASWATWIQINSGDWNAVADVPKVESAMRFLVAADPSFRDGWPYLYLGVVTTQLPPAYGGKPEEGQAFFKKALELSRGNNLMVHVLYAQQYARLVFNQELHDSLLREVLASDSTEPHFTLINTLAKKRAAELLAESVDYF